MTRSRLPPHIFCNIILLVAVFQKAQGDIDQFVVCTAFDQFAVAVEIGANAHVVDTDQIRYMINVAYGIGKRCFSASSLIKPL